MKQKRFILRTSALSIFVLTMAILAYILQPSQPSAQAAGEATALYVDGSTGNDANAGSSAAPYKTIAKANASVGNGAGDTIYIRSGVVYNEALIPDGFAKDNVNYLAWNKTGDDPLRLPPVIDTPSNVSAFVLKARHHITIDGFYFRDPGVHFGWLENSNNITLRNNFFDQAPSQIIQSDPVYTGIYIAQSSHHIVIQENHWNRWGEPRAVDGTPGRSGDFLRLDGVPKEGGEPSDANPGTHHVLIDHNFFDGFDPDHPKDSSRWGNGANAGHSLLNLGGRWIVVRNNSFFNLSQKNVDSVGYQDGEGVHDATQILWEGNLFKRGREIQDTQSGAYGGFGLSVAATNYIIRFNQFDRNARSGLQLGAWGDYGSFPLVRAVSGNLIYHNTFYHNGFTPDEIAPNMDAISMYDARPQSFGPKNSHNNEIRNNIFYDNSGAGGINGAVEPGTTQMSFYLLQDDGNFGLNQNFIKSNLFYRPSGATGNEIIIYTGAPTPGPYGPIAEHPYHFPANAWNTQDETLLGNPYLIEANLVADPKLDTTTFALQTGSAAIGAAWALDYSTNAGNNATTLQVNNAYWFSDGFGGLVEADTLRLGSESNSPIVKIAKINYSTHTITLASPATWPNGVQIYLYKLSDGRRVLFDGGPDIGAVQYNGGANPTPTAIPSTPTPTPVVPPTATPTTPAVTATSPATATPANPSGPNLIQNGDFNQGETMWSIGGMGMGYGFEQNQLCLTFAQVIPNPADAGVSQTGLMLEAGKRYRASLTAWSQSAATIKLIVGESQPPWQNYLNQLLTLSAGQTKTYLYEFTMNSNGDPHAGLFFHVGGHNSAKICLDNLELRVVEDNATATPIATTTPHPSATPSSTPIANTGSIRGSVKNESGAGLAKMRVYAYRLRGNSWSLVKRVDSNANGSYQLTQLTAGSYRLRFLDASKRYHSEFFDNATTLNSATSLTLPAGSTLSGIDAILVPAQASSATIQGSVAYWNDEATGHLQINAWQGSVFTITYPASCGNTNAKVQAVSLVVGSKPFAMTKQLETGTYAVALRVPVDITAGQDYAVEVRWLCVDGGTGEARQKSETQDAVIGAVDVGNHPASGQVISSLTGQPLANALVTLYRVADWRPRSSPSDNAANTCESTASKPAGTAWSQLAPDEAGEWISPQADEAMASLITPALNPQLTGEDGRFAWTVSEGCWYVEVEAEGYTVSRSPVIGTNELLTEVRVDAQPANRLFLPVAIH